VHADEPAPRQLHVAVLAVDRHVPSRVRLELPDRTHPHTDTTDPQTDTTGRAAATAEETTR
jgi:hypothetical protein